MKKEKPMTKKEFKEWARGRILLSIRDGKFNEVIDNTIDMAMNWEKVKYERKI